MFMECHKGIMAVAALAVGSCWKQEVAWSGTGIINKVSGFLCKAFA